MNAHNNREVEVKLAVSDLTALRRKLAKLKARASAGARLYEMNFLFDTPQGGLAKHGQLLRLRLEAPAGKSSGTKPAKAGKGGRALLTYKGPAISDGSGLGRRYKVREELEATVAEPDRLRQILEALGLRGWFRYEKYRTTYQLPASQRWAVELKVEFDETPIGAYLELEGRPEAIDRAASLLGYKHSDYITKSYLQLYLEQCRKQGRPPADMLFAPEKK